MFDIYNLLMFQRHILVGTKYKNISKKVHTLTSLRISGILMETTSLIKNRELLCLLRIFIYLSVVVIIFIRFYLSTLKYTLS